jgi:hypothetical protein
MSCDHFDQQNQASEHLKMWQVQMLQNSSGPEILPGYEESTGKIDSISL